MMCGSGAPLAYAAPRMLPMLLPAMEVTGISFSSNACSTPKCAYPRAKPPPSARLIPQRGEEPAPFQDETWRCLRTNIRMLSEGKARDGQGVPKWRYQSTQCKNIGEKAI